MTTTLIPTTQKTVDRLVQELTHLYGENLASVCVYGSSVWNSQGQANNINVMILLHKLDTDGLERASSLSKWWETQAHTLPMFMSVDEWQRSADAFALEYTDIRDHHVVVYGEDRFTQVPTDQTSLRLVCELELHRKLIYLRQRLLVHRDSPKDLLHQLVHAIGSLAALGRGVLRFKTEKPPMAPQAVFEALAQQVEGFDASPFIRVLEAKTNPNSARLTDVPSLYAQLVLQLAGLTAYVDAHHPGHAPACC